MERRSFNDVLREKEEQKKQEQLANDDGHIALDDAKRIKVLSPGQLVFKRFIRNKLAIFGVCVLVVMFLFAFAAPLLYPYGYKDTFYKYGHQFNQYAVATVRQDYTNYTVNTDVPVGAAVKRNITSAIKDMESGGYDYYVIVVSEDETYVLEKVGDKIYVLSVNDGGHVAMMASDVEIATYNTTLKQFTYRGDAQPAEFEQAATDAMAAGETSFSYNGMNYVINRSNKVELSIRTDGAGIAYTGSELGAAFERALNEAVESKTPGFKVGGTEYIQLTTRGVTNVYSVVKGEEALIASTLAYSGPGSDDIDFLNKLYYNAGAEGSFEHNGATYSVVRDEGNTYIVFDGEGEEIGLLSDFVIRDISGNDTISLANKEAIQDVVMQMMASGATGENTGATEPVEEEDNNEALDDIVVEDAEEEFAHAAGVAVALSFEKKSDDYIIGEDGKPMPILNDVYDEDGNPVYETIMGKIVRKGEYFYVSCNQWSYLMDTNGRPSARHILGTDTDGYDVLSRMMYGGRISLLVGFVVVFIETILGVIMGGIAGYFGGWVDNLIMRLVDIFYCIPSMPILIIMGAFMDSEGLDPIPRLMWMMAILGFLGWAGVARLTRGQILSLREQEFMVATEATGVKVSRRIFRHLIPNVMPQLIVSATAGLGGVILTESTLSFLGLGVKRPMATWGAIISGITSSNENILNFTYIWIPVGFLICLTVIAFNFVGDGLRDAFDPKMKR